MDTNLDDMLNNFKTPKKFYFMSDVLPDDNPDESKQTISDISQTEPSVNPESLTPDRETSNLIKWFAKEQKLSKPEDAVKRAVLVAAYIHDVIANKGGKLFVQRKDGSYLREVKETKDNNSGFPLALHKANLQVEQEKTRAKLATYLIYILASTIGVSFGLIIGLVIGSIGDSGR